MKNTSDPFEILFQDDHLAIINKPAGLPVHKSGMAATAQKFALQELRNQLGQHVYPVHRLDSKTSGVLIFGLNPEVCGRVQNSMQANRVEKGYFSINRGYLPDSGKIEHPVKNERGNTKEATTYFHTLGKTEMNWRIGRYPTARYSLVQTKPITGRYHQIRLHFNHLRHPVIGDNKHGDLHHNHFFRDELDCSNLLLHCFRMIFPHPVSGKSLSVSAPLPTHFLKILDRLQLSLAPEEIVL